MKGTHQGEKQCNGIKKTERFGKEEGGHTLTTVLESSVEGGEEEKRLKLIDDDKTQE